MAALVKAVQISRTINNMTKLLTNISLSSTNHTHVAPSPLCTIQRIGNPVASFHTTRKCADLMEFFEVEKNWGQNEIKVGRSWKLDELRIKSNEDLHKLWYVLLKERNMLLTMEEHYKRIWEYFPNPERIDKVKESMKNLETVVQERNTAYHRLETGEDGKRPSKVVYNQLGVKFKYRMRQYFVPQFINNKWHQNHKFGFGGYAVRKFRRLYKEKKLLSKLGKQWRDKLRVMTLIKRFPNMDLEALKLKYPKVDVDAIIKKDDKSIRGHYLPK